MVFAKPRCVKYCINALVRVIANELPMSYKKKRTPPQDDNGKSDGSPSILDPVRVYSGNESVKVNI